MNYELIEDGMALWEAVLEMRRDLPWLDEYFENQGTCAARNAVPPMVAPCQVAWKYAQTLGFDAPFDWEFCPWFISQCEDFTVPADILDRVKRWLDA